MPRRLRPIALLLSWIVMPPPGVTAQTPDFSGTWVLDAAASRVVPGAGLAALGAVSTPERLHITHAVNGDVAVQSEWNTSEARVYRPGRETVIPVGPDDAMTVAARWDGATLVAEGRRATPGGGSTIVGVRQALTLSADGERLTIDAATITTDGDRSSTIVYTRLADLGPCREWSEPCQPR